MKQHQIDLIARLLIEKIVSDALDRDHTGMDDYDEFENVFRLSMYDKEEHIMTEQEHFAVYDSIKKYTTHLCGKRDIKFSTVKEIIHYAKGMIPKVETK